MTPKQAVGFVKKHGIVLESGRGPVPSLAEAIAGGPIRGSWWAHPGADTIFLCTRAVRKSPEVLVCRLAGGKVTFVHRRLWPALVRLAGRFEAARLAAIHEIHMPSGKHIVRATPFRDWIPAEAKRAAKAMTDDAAAALLSPLLPAGKLTRRTPR